MGFTFSGQEERRWLGESAMLGVRLYRRRGHAEGDHLYKTQTSPGSHT